MLSGELHLELTVARSDLGMSLEMIPKPKVAANVLATSIKGVDVGTSAVRSPPDEVSTARNAVLSHRLVIDL